jgi:hypothetical protein
MGDRDSREFSFNSYFILDFLLLLSYFDLYKTLPTIPTLPKINK